MSSPTYTIGSPVPTNPPGNDVVNMQNNSIAISNWTTVDHVTFGSAVSGTHNQVTFPVVATGPNAPWKNAYPMSQIFQQAFSAVTEELYFADGSNTRTSINRLVPTIKAMGQFNCNGNIGLQPINIANTLYVNLASVSAASGGGLTTFTVTFTTPLDFATYYPIIVYINAIPSNPAIVRLNGSFTFMGTNTNTSKLAFLVI